MPCSSEAIAVFLGKRILFAPSKAANAGGVAVSGLEMVQNSMRLSWQGSEVDERLRIIIGDIHRTCLATAEEYGTPGNYLNGANIAGFVKVVNAMLDQGVL
jgi:glutamate dehydrogenase (NADP+)